MSCIPHPREKRIKKLKSQIPVAAQLTAEYRLRIGPYRLLYDVDDRQKRVVLLKLLKRNERTYK
ncbi:MAG: hypothetical protein D6690_05355 [Nitrospirae bacterium]|nr:MAG: hypothetical protein D6690_05355 [Nitrospirota bacterium]